MISAAVKLNGGRHVQGILRGFDPFMNLVVDETLEMGPGGQQSSIGMVVSTPAGANSRGFKGQLQVCLLRDFHCFP